MNYSFSIYKGNKTEENTIFRCVFKAADNAHADDLADDIVDVWCKNMDAKRKENFSRSEVLPSTETTVSL